VAHYSDPLAVARTRVRLSPNSNCEILASDFQISQRAFSHYGKPCTLFNPSICLLPSNGQVIQRRYIQVSAPAERAIINVETDAVCQTHHSQTGTIAEGVRVNKNQRIWQVQLSQSSAPAKRVLADVGERVRQVQCCELGAPLESAIANMCERVGQRYSCKPRAVEERTIVDAQDELWERHL
jgi:hypothetical protein